MTDTPKSSRRSAPRASWALPLAYWQDQVARAHERAGLLSDRAADLGETDPDGNREMLDELLATFEELQVAEAELRAQNDELQDARSQIEHERAHYAELFRRAPAPFIVTDSSGTIQQANASTAALLGCRVDGLTGKPLLVFVHGASRRRIRDAIDAIQHGEERLTLTITIDTRHGTTVRAEVSVATLQSFDGGDGQMMWLLVDQTHRFRREARRKRSAERLERLVRERTAALNQATQVKDRLIATVSHEFRTALGAIGGYAELLEMGVHGPLSEPQQDDIRRIQRIFQHLATLVDDLLNYSRIASGRIELTGAEIVAMDLLRAAAEFLAPQARERNITIHVGARSDQAVIYADPERARQIMINLLSNAVKFTRSGGAVWLDYSGTDRDVLIEVRDDGPGIPEDRLDEIFFPFVRLQTAVPTAGTGLGLAISRDLARAMHGDLTVSSAVGVGSTFVLRLPRVSSAERDATSS